MEEVAVILASIVRLLGFAIFFRSILSWFPIDRNGPIVRTLDAITEPVLEPLRRVIPLVGMVDITPMVAILALFFIASALESV